MEDREGTQAGIEAIKSLLRNLKDFVRYTENALIRGKAARPDKSR
jgi:hypothetical protein